MKKLAIIGRPNVGKSTLFNRLAGKKLAIVDDTPGVTRDRRYAPGNLAGLEFTLIDTAGMEEAKHDALETRMLAQTNAAIREADVLLLVIDARVGITGADEHFAELVRRANKPTLLLLNKSEGKAGDDTAIDAYRFGMGEPLRISAEHGEGMGDFFNALLPYIEDTHVEEEEAPREKKAKKPRAASAAAAKKKAAAALSIAVEEDDDDDVLEEEEIPIIQIAIVGRPNAGKSTLINALLHEDRLLTGPEAGITRDAIAVDYEYDGKPIKLVDTAGMRRKANVTGKLEGMSVSDSLRAIQYAHVVVVMMDATIPLEKQDATIAALVEREGRACVLALSKWDLIEDKSALMKEVRYQCDMQLPQMKDITIVPLSAIKGKGLEKLMDACFATYAVWNKRISTARLNRWLEAALDTHTPPLISGRRLKIKYMTQIKSRPPTFQLFTNIADGFPDAYMRYLVNGMRQTFELPGVPLRILLKAGTNPFEHKKKRQKK